MTQLVITGRSSFILYFSSYGFTSIDFEWEKKSQVILLREPSLTHCACLYLMTAPLCSKPQIISACCYLVSYLLKKMVACPQKPPHTLSVRKWLYSYQDTAQLELSAAWLCYAKTPSFFTEIFCEFLLIFADYLLVLPCLLFFCSISGALWPDCWRFLVIKAGNQIPFFFWLVRKQLLDAVVFIFRV